MIDSPVMGLLVTVSIATPRSRRPLITDQLSACVFPDLDADAFDRPCDGCFVLRIAIKKKVIYTRFQSADDKPAARHRWSLCRRRRSGVELDELATRTRAPATACLVIESITVPAIPPASRRVTGSTARSSG